MPNRSRVLIRSGALVIVLVVVAIRFGAGVAFPVVGLVLGVLMPGAAASRRVRDWRVGALVLTGAVLVLTSAAGLMLSVATETTQVVDISGATSH